MNPSTLDDRQDHARRLVRAYITDHREEVSPEVAEYLLGEEKIAPLGVLILFEMFRLAFAEERPDRISYSEMQTIIARRVPDGVVSQRITQTGVFYLADPKRAHQQARTDTLIQLSLSFGWPMEWLRQVNREAQDTTIHETLTPQFAELGMALQRNPQVAPAVAHLLRLAPDQQRAASAFILAIKPT